MDTEMERSDVFKKWKDLGYEHAKSKLQSSSSKVDKNLDGIFEHVLKGNLDFPSDLYPSISESAKHLDEICHSISENVIDVLLQCIDEADVQKNKIITRSCCSLLSKVRGLPTLYFFSPDQNKDAIRTEGLIPMDMIRSIIDNGL